MKLFWYLVTLVATILNSISCNDSGSDTTTVWGTMKADTPSPATVLNGNTIGDNGADYKGFCRYKDKKFSFSIGDPPPTTLYFEINDIEGPPSEDPYLEGETLRTDDNKFFYSGTIWNKDGAWAFSPDDIIDDRCKVLLFSTGGEGDRTPKKFGKKSFQYVVKIDCHTGLNKVPNEYDDASFELSGFEIELWFSNCDT